MLLSKESGFEVLRKTPGDFNDFLGSVTQNSSIFIVSVDKKSKANMVKFVSTSTTILIL